MEFKDFIIYFQYSNTSIVLEFENFTTLITMKSKHFGLQIKSTLIALGGLKIFYMKSNVSQKDSNKFQN